MDISNPMPPEIIHSVVQNLSHDGDRQTLLNASLCSRVLCDESQRVLFRATTGSHWDILQMDREQYFRRHLSFLSSIRASPHRLAKHVHTYIRFDVETAWSGSRKSGAQFISCDCHAISATLANLDPTVQRLVEGTTEGLTIMTNLRWLALGELQHQYADVVVENPGYTLSNCSFKLQSFEWYMLDADGLNSVHRFILDTQPSLINLYLPPLTGEWKDGKSTLCEPLVVRPQIRALSLPRNFNAAPAGRSVFATFKNIRYLSFQFLDAFRVPVSPTPWTNIVLIHASYTIPQDIGVLSSQNFPNLAVVVLGFNYRPAHPTNNSVLNAFMLFHMCSQLRYVDCLHQTGTRADWCIYRYRPSRSAQTNSPVIMKINYGYPDYWWQPHVQGVGEEIRASMEL